MKTPMQKMSLIVYHKEKDSILHALREVGLVHVNVNDFVQSENIQNLQNELSLSEKTYLEIEKIYNEKTKAGETVSQVDRGNPEDILKDFSDLKKQKSALYQEQDNLRQILTQLEPWGDFNPEHIKTLKNHGMTLRFLSAPKQKYEDLFESSENTEASSETDTSLPDIKLIHPSAQSYYFVSIERRDNQKKVVDKLIESSEIEEHYLPLMSVSGINKKIDSLSAEIDKINIEIEKFAEYKKFLYAFICYEKNKLSMEKTGLSMNPVLDEKAFSIEGWFPENEKYKVTEVLDDYKVWYRIEDPAHDDNPPVKLQNKKPFKFFEPITKILSLPDYFEIDPTPFFAPLFAVFFGLCLGDAGYGLIMAAAALLLKIKMKKSDFSVFLNLGIIFGVFTIINGFFLNTLFGQPIFQISGNEGAFFPDNDIAGLAVLSPFKKDGSQNFPAMAFAIYIGVFQMILGMILHGYNRIKNHGLAYGISPFGKILLSLGVIMILANIYDHKGFMDIGTLSLGVIPIGYFFGTFLTMYQGVLLSVSGILFLSFEDPKKNILIQFIKMPLNIYNFASSFAADALSYIRLFALGLAGGLLGNAFNQIALMFVETPDGYNFASPMIIFTVIVMIVGHALNFGLAALGAFVHSLRLTFVEFYNNLEFTGGSKPYTPFRRYR